jgi:AraC-like DNA-binding protein
MVSKDFELYYYNDKNVFPQLELHTHSYYECYFFLEGNVKMQIQDAFYDLTYGDLVLIPPGLVHTPVMVNMDIPYRRFVLWFSQDYCNYLTKISTDYAYLQQYVQIHKRYIFHNDNIQFNSIQSRILRLLEEMHSKKFGRLPQISLCLDDLILHLNRLLYEKEHQNTAPSTKSLYQNVLGYIETHLYEPLSLELLANEFYVSKYHLAHVFKEQMGISIHQHIMKKRLYQCKEAIQSGENITKVYQQFGFGDYSGFYRAFKKEYGISPKDCQEMALDPSALPSKKQE